MTFSNSGYGVAEAPHTVLPICCQVCLIPKHHEFSQKAWLEREQMALSIMTLSSSGTVLSPLASSHQCCVSFFSSHSSQNLLECVSQLQTALGLCSQDFCASLNLKNPTRACVLEHMGPSWSQFGEVVESLRPKAYPLSVGHQGLTPRVMASFLSPIFVSWPEVTVLSSCCPRPSCCLYVSLS